MGKELTVRNGEDSVRQGEGLLRFRGRSTLREGGVTPLMARATAATVLLLVATAFAAVARAQDADIGVRLNPQR